MKNATTLLAILLLSMMFTMVYAQNEGYHAHQRKSLTGKRKRAIKEEKAYLFETAFYANTGVIAKHAPMAWGLGFSSINKFEKFGFGFSMGFSNSLVKQETVVTEAEDGRNNYSFYHSTPYSYSTLKKFNTVDFGYDFRYQLWKKPYYPYIGANASFQLLFIEDLRQVEKGETIRYIDETKRTFGFKFYTGASYEIGKTTRISCRLGYSLQPLELPHFTHRIFFNIGIELFYPTI